MFRKIIIGLIVTGTILPGIVSAEDINPVIGKTADFVFREVDLDRLIGSQPLEIQKKFQDDPEQRVSLVRQLLTQKAVAARARKEGFDRKADIREQLSYVIDDFIVREYLTKVVAATASVPEEELKKYYQEKQSTFIIQEKIKVRHILVEAPNDLPPDAKNKALARAEAVLQRLKKGEDFAALAKEASEDPDSGKRGGVLGTLTPGSTGSDDFEKAAFALKAGETSGIVATAYGYHIIRVDERTEKRTATFEEAREYIQKTLLDAAGKKKVQEFVDLTIKEAGLELFPEKISGKKEAGSGNVIQK